MINNLLLGLVETILGSGDEKSKGNVAFYCPKCKHHKKKLEVNLITTTDGKNPWACWVCNNFKGTTLKSLFISLKVNTSKFEDLNDILGTSYKYRPEDLLKTYNIELPKNFQNFINLKKSNIIGRHALSYLLNKRKISFEDIIKHNIGFCEYGPYKNKIIIPSYSKSGTLDYFVARAFDDNEYSIDAPESDKNIIGFESMINWELPIILCEGPFDAISIKRNAIPLFGKNISNNLKKKLVLNRVKSIYLSLDEDALKQTLRISEELLNLGKEIFVVRLNSKDPNELGFNAYTNIIQNSKPFTYSDLIKLKMEI